MYFDWNFDNGSCVRRSVEKGHLARKIMLTEKQKSKRIKEKRVKNNSTKLYRSWPNFMLLKHMTQTEEENKQLELVAKNTAIEIMELKATTVYMYSCLETNNQELNSLKKEVMNLKRHNIKVEAYTRREYKNIKIFGIKDKQG